MSASETVVDPQPLARAPVRVRLRDALRRRRRVLVALLASLGVLVVLRVRGAGASAEGPEAALAVALAKDGLEVDPASVVWLEPDRGALVPRPVIFLARRGDELHDVYFAEALVARARTVLDVALATNLTRSSSADETSLVRSGDFAAYASRVGGRHDAFVLVDLRGEPGALTANWPRRARVQNAVTNLQETGRAQGFGRTRFALTVPAATLSLAFDGPRLVATTPDGRVVVEPARTEPVEGATLVSVQPQDKSQPGQLTWVVDTVRNLSFVGPEPIAWLENRVFAVKDWVERTRYAATGGDRQAEADEAASDLTFGAPSRPRHDLLTATDPELGWPPAAIPPVLHDTVRGEGEWLPLDADPFVRRTPNAPPAFVQTFLRVDPERSYARVYVTLWDPRQVQLRVMMGTREPESATGETGPGMVSRDPRTMRRLVAGFNGGFQALHGEFGMMADGHVYLPPKPWAATVAVFDDGHVAMGSWAGPPENTREYDEGWATAQIPPGLVEMRQNLTSVVEDGQFNPWSRWWWGAAPASASEQTFTHRTGLCLTREGFLAYFWGASMGPDQLGAAMNAVRCVRGMHLDMNDRLSHFEFYDAWGPDETRAAIDRPLTDAEYEGVIPDDPRHALDGWHVRARKAVRSMEPFRFPQYLPRNPRDFFYLTLRPVLPGPDLPDVPEGRFSTRGLPHSGWPHAFARLSVGPEGERIWLVRIDPARALPAPVAPGGSQRTLGWLSRGQGADGALRLYAQRETVGFRFAVGSTLPPGALEIARGGARRDEAVSALGVDRDGFLVYAERDGAAQTSLSEVLGKAGVEDWMELPPGSRLLFETDGASAGVDGSETAAPRNGLQFFAAERPATEVMFPDNTPRPYRVWGRLQGARVRYIPTTPPRFTGRPATPAP